MAVNKDIAIVGGGILALTLAHELLKDDNNVKLLIIRPKTPDGAASLAAGAMLGCFSEVTSKTFSNPYHQKKFEISYQASHLWPNHIEQIELASNHRSELPIITSDGTFIMQNTHSGVLEDKNYQAIIDALNLYEIAYDSIAPTDIPGLNPIADSRPLHSIYFGSEKGVDPYALLSRLEIILEESGRCEFIDGVATELVNDEHSVHGFKDQNGQTYLSSQIVLACGSFCQNLIDKLPIRYRIPRLYYGVGNALVAEAESSKIRHIIRSPNRSFACGLHILPRQGNQVYIGATNNVAASPESKPRISLISFLIQCAMEQVDRGLHDSKLVELVAGNRSVSMDTYPVIGPTSMAGLWVMTGTYRDGFQQSPYIAKYLSSALLERSTVESIFQEFAHFPAERFPIQATSHEHAIKESVEHYLSGAYEHQIMLPRVGWDDMFRDMITHKIECLFDALGDDCVMPPELVLMFDSPEREALIESVRDFHRRSREEFGTN